MERKTKTGTSNLLLEHAFKQLHAPLYFYALKFISDSEMAKDVVQDAFLSILHANEKNDIDNLKAYLYCAVRNNCLNHIKHQGVESKYAEKEQTRGEREIAFYDSHQTLVEKELQQRINTAVEALPEQYKVPFKLSRFEELKTKQIAEQLNLPARTVETQIYRALKILREKIGNQGIIMFSLFSFKKM